MANTISTWLLLFTLNSPMLDTAWFPPNTNLSMMKADYIHRKCLHSKYMCGYMSDQSFMEKNNFLILGKAEILTRLLMTRKSFVWSNYNKYRTIVQSFSNCLHKKLHIFKIYGPQRMLSPGIAFSREPLGGWYDFVLYLAQHIMSFDEQLHWAR